MKIFFRYLLIRLLVPFAISLAACTIIFVMVDLYGTIDDFLEHKINILLILRFYALKIPSMLVQVLPPTLLFSTLATLLALNRRCELVAFQSGGMAPFWLFSPFFAFALLLVAILGIDMSGPASRAQVTCERLLQQVKGQTDGRNTLANLPYVDSANHRVWFFQKIDTNQGTAKGIEILFRDAQGHDMEKYFAREAKWTGESWRLSGVLEIVFGLDGTVVNQKTYEEKELDITTPPKQLSFIVSQPDQLTLNQLSQYIETSTSTPEHLAGYRTEWWYRVLYPFSLIILMLFALLQGTRKDRHGAAAGVIWAIVVFILYIVFMHIFMAAGRFNRLPPFIAVVATEVIFGCVGLHLLAISNGWWWQLLEVGKRWRAEWIEDEKEVSSE